MAYHHHPEEAEERFLGLVSMVHVADALAERAIRHSKSRAWKVGMAHRGPGATEQEWTRAVDLDGVGEIAVTDLLFQVPPRIDPGALKGVIRSVLLKLESRRQTQKLSVITRTTS